MREKLIVALDVETADQALSLTESLAEYVGAFKVGLQLYNHAGPEIVKRLTDAGIKVFLDLKFHDIPNTAARAAEAVVSLGAFMFNVHAAGGKQMLQETAVAARAKAAALQMPAPLLIGVTVLTSLSEKELQAETGVKNSLPEQVSQLAHLSKEAGLDGVVASAHEIPWIRKACGEQFVIVTPGIRPLWAAGNDQQRIATPQEALSLGADYLVIGRPLTAAANPQDAAKRLLDDISGI